MNPKPIKVKITYNDKLKEITGVDSEEAVVSEGLTFMGLLHFLFSSYPEIYDNYPPGTLGFLINGIPPRSNATPIQDGDEIHFAGMS